MRDRPLNDRWATKPFTAQESKQMRTEAKKTHDPWVEKYNEESHQALTKSLSYGSMVRQRTTLAELSGLATNDNMKGE